MVNDCNKLILHTRKFIQVRAIINEWIEKNALIEPTLLDIGCRDCVLKNCIPENVNYVGLDMAQNKHKTVTHVGSFPYDFLFSAQNFDITCALDCLEHMDDIQFGLEEMLRITSRMAVIVLPNMSHVVFRLKYLLTGRIGDKYDLRTDSGKDRHRWLTTLRQSDVFIEEIAKRNGFKFNVTHIIENSIAIGKYGYVLSQLFSFLGLNWAAWSSLYTLERRS